MLLFHTIQYKKNGAFVTEFTKKIKEVGLAHHYN